MYSKVHFHFTAPSRNLRELVERLRGQLVEKEGQLETLRDSLRQVRSDLVDTAQKTLQVHYIQFSVVYV